MEPVQGRCAGGDQKIIGKCVDFLPCVVIMKDSWYYSGNMTKAETEKSSLLESSREKNIWWKFFVTERR
ncbi:hypothetical protein CE91St63_22610 [[Clostridium] hylemonae]|nr:hypothetical protein CE91St63_22610 [[Clostridium] hylemonae]